MRRILKNKLTIIISFILAIFMTVAGQLSLAICLVKADSQIPYDQSNVLDDLTNSTIKGEKFNLEKYSFDSNKDTQVLSFIEYCYSFYKEKQSDYGLYVYVYNPKGLKLSENSELNNISLSVRNDNSTNYIKYPLIFLNKCIKQDYEGLFYKFKVNLNEKQKAFILNNLNSTNRVYKVSSIELLTTGNTNATDYTVGTSYKYSGYAKGYGSNNQAEDTLKVTSESIETLSLKVHSTVYRPSGTNGKNDYTQDSLHSVYFAVPKVVTNKYGTMSAIHATWLNAILNPVYVTGNQEIYSAVQKHLGKYVHGGYLKSPPNTDFIYTLIATKAVEGLRGTVDASMSGYLAYNAIMDNYNMTEGSLYDKVLYYLYMAFNAGQGVDSADNYTVKSEDILLKLKESPSKYGGELVNGKYSKCMFSQVDDKFTDINISADEKFNLESQLISKSWWDVIFGKEGNVTTSIFDGIKAIYPVNESDMTGTSKEVSDRLFIAESDYDDFKSFYNSNKELSTIYLFRYQVSDYVSQEVTNYQLTTDTALIGGKFNTYKVLDTNAYFFTETVNLDFDIIDITFSTGQVSTVIPVVSNPIDVIPDATPPVNTESDKEPDWVRWIKIALIVIGSLILLVFLWPLIRIIIKSIVLIISLPFKAIESIVKKKKDKRGK